MKVLLESTSQIVEIEAGDASTQARVWEGCTAQGVQVQALIVRIAVHRDDDYSRFEAELIERPPRAVGYHVFPVLLLT